MRLRKIFAGLIASAMAFTTMASMAAFEVSAETKLVEDCSIPFDITVAKSQWGDWLESSYNESLMDVFSSSKKMEEADQITITATVSNVEGANASDFFIVPFAQVGSNWDWKAIDSTYFSNGSVSVTYDIEDLGITKADELKTCGVQFAVGNVEEGQHITADIVYSVSMTGEFTTDYTDCSYVESGHAHIYDEEASWWCQYQPNLSVSDLIGDIDPEKVESITFEGDNQFVIGYNAVDYAYFNESEEYSHWKSSQPSTSITIDDIDLSDEGFAIAFVGNGAKSTYDIYWTINTSDGILKEGEYNQFAFSKEVVRYQRYVKVVKKSELEGMHKATFTFTYNGNVYSVDKKEYYTSCKAKNVRYTAEDGCVLLVLTVKGVPSDTVLDVTCELS